MINEFNELIYMNRQEAKDIIEKNKVAILPIGSIEQHGPHLPQGTDILIAIKIAKEISKEKKYILLPPIYVGYSWVWEGIIGSLSISRNHLEKHLTELAKAIKIAGFKKLIIINGHDSNNSTLKYWSRNLEKIIPDLKTRYFMYPGINKIYKEELNSNMWENIYHAGELETSLMMYLYPYLVNEKELTREYPPINKKYGNSTLKLGSISRSGIFGDATLASKTKGEKLFKKFVCNILERL